MKTEKRSATVCFGVAIHQILVGSFQANKLEMSLVADAIRRSTSKLSDDSSLGEIREYLAGYSGKSLDGLLANIKGIYHELIFVNAENYDDDSLSARIFGETNHPGADVEFLIDGEVIEQVQLKAVMDKNIILEHFETYPDISVYATSEVAENFESVADSGFSNEQLEKNVKDFADQFGFSDLLGKTVAGFSLGAIGSLALAVAFAIKGRRLTKEDLRQAVKDGYISAAFAALVDFLLNDDRWPF